MGSTNPVKIKATKGVFKRLFGEVDVRGVKVPTYVRQPIGYRQTIRGSVRRARKARKQSPNADFTVGIEAGLIPCTSAHSGYFDQQFAAVMDKRGIITIGGGSAFEYPECVVKEVTKKRREVGEIMEELSGIREIGEKQGAIGYLSHGQLNRIELTEQALFMSYTLDQSNSVLRR
ncbi:MAG: inosine/xanthosine triphosphatase [Candidatus Bathyarchaeia archaeon]